MRIFLAVMQKEILNCIKIKNLVNISHNWCFYCSFKLDYKILQTFHLLCVLNTYVKLQIFKIYANFIRYILKKKAQNTFDAVFCENIGSSLDVPFNQSRRQAKYFCILILFSFHAFQGCTNLSHQFGPQFPTMILIQFLNEGKLYT